MTVCKYFLQNRCAYGDSCKFEHSRNNNQNQNRFAPLQNGSAGGQRGRSGAFGGESKREDFGVTAENIRIDLTSGNGGERPTWPCSSYGPGLNAPRQLLEGPVEISQEEMRVKYYLAQATGRQQEYIHEEQALLNQVNSQIQTILRNPEDAKKYIVDGQDVHPNRRDEVFVSKTPFDRSGTAQQQSSGGLGQQAGAFGASSAPVAGGFGQASVLGAQRPAFGAPSAPASAFGQPAALGTNPGFGKLSALGGGGGGGAGGGAFGQPSALGQSNPFGGAQNASPFGQSAQQGAGASAFGKPSQPSFGQSGFGTAAKPAFGAPSQPGHSAFGASSQPGQSAFGASSQTAQPAFGGSSQPVQSAFGQPSKPGQSAFGQPSQPGQSAFGQPSQSGQSAFGQPSLPGQSAFGQPSQPGQSAFDQSSQPNGFGGGQQQQSDSGFGSVSSLGAKPNPFAAASQDQNGKPASNPFSTANPNANPSPFGAPSQPAQASTGNPFAKPAAGGFGAPSANDTARASPFGAPHSSAAGRAPTTEPWGTAWNATTFHGKPIVRDDKGHPCTESAVDVEVTVHGRRQTQRKTRLDRVWFPDGPVHPAGDVPNPDAVRDREAPAPTYEGALGETLAELYRFVMREGTFKDGIMPEIPPRLEWIDWDL